MEVLNNNLAEVLVYLGLAILAIEVVVLGFSTFALFFLGLGCAVTGVAMFLGIIPETSLSAIIGVAILTAASACLLWRPLQKMQNKVDHSAVQNDLIGHSFILDTEVSQSQSGIHNYSGIDWKILSDDTLEAGTEVEVIKVEVGEFTVAAKAKD